MKKVLIIILLSLTSCNMTKVIKMKSDKFPMREMQKDGWSDFIPWADMGAEIDIKTKKFFKRKTTIVVKDQELSHYKVIKAVEETKSVGGEKVLIFNCKDDHKVKCLIMMIGGDTSLNFVVYYSNLNLCYNILK